LVSASAARSWGAAAASPMTAAQPVHALMLERPETRQYGN
jgi:hypothetical protein